MCLSLCSASAQSRQCHSFSSNVYGVCQRESSRPNASSLGLCHYLHDTHDWQTYQPTASATSLDAAADDKQPSSLSNM